LHSNGERASNSKTMAEGEAEEVAGQKWQVCEIRKHWRLNKANGLVGRIGLRTTQMKKLHKEHP